MDYTTKRGEYLWIVHCLARTYSLSMPSSPFEIERRYLSHLPLRLQLPMLSTHGYTKNMGP